MMVSVITHAHGLMEGQLPSVLIQAGCGRARFGRFGMPPSLRETGHPARYRSPLSFTGIERAQHLEVVRPSTVLDWEDSRSEE